ncbi:DUF924 family protein [Paracraurococcus ruber]|uniref:DUF924 domain-containing protein n=1 Tax=Paracraurococcus ruber TaxID=77675 RepID=A0ABS1D406_9PROT|nr:DUF924 family protein [Paracraurococcus ruber]MBK1661340.1 hypothetical protein [Paracraurococcus ruber]TDG27392.1 DUF924 domain-containing protein [Paracraurococcus ruber]
MTTAAAILNFWFGGDLALWRGERWFRPDPEFDAACGAGFGTLLAPARDGALDAWAATPEGALALLLLLDQVPRNLHRGTAAAFAGDPKARAVARQAVLRDRHDLALPPTARCFLYLPFEHAEDMADQDLSVALFEGLRDDPVQAGPQGSIGFAWAHRAVIRRFGRFPHRNAALGRDSTPAERDWLAAGGGF